MKPSHRDIMKLQEYQRADVDLRVRQLLIGHVLTIILVPGGSTLDYFVYPQYWWPFFMARMICAGLQVPMLGLLMTRYARNWTRSLCFVWPLMPGILISWFIWYSEGSISTYYAGLNLVIIIACFLLPYTFREALAICMAATTSYILACFFHKPTPFDKSLFFSNMFFITLTSIIAITACYALTRRRLDDFWLRHELAERNDQLAEMDRLKSQFFANVSHELRTPLTLILGPAEDLLRRDSDLSEAARSALALVKQNALRLLSLINDLLELVRLEGKQVEVDQRPIDIGRFLPGIVDSIRHLAQSKGLKVGLESMDKPLVVLGDTTRLEKVFLNLLTNAIKFTEASGRITVRMGRDDDWVYTEFEDTGVGISQEELPHIFERFRQVDGSTTRQYQGLGLGLALARELVEEHGGQLEARSIVGQGTTFKVTLPRMEEVVFDISAQLDSTEDPLLRMYGEAARSQPVAVTSGKEMVGQGKHRILVVDDEEDMRQFLVSSLSHEYRVSQASDGNSGLRLALDDLPDAVILDLMMPGMNGLDICEAIRQDARAGDIKIILLTAKVDEASKLEALNRGADDFLTKPFSTIEVTTRLANLLRTADLQRDLRERNTELRNTLDQLKSTEAKLVQSEKMNALGSLAAGLLHEINNPLNYTLTAIQLLQHNTSDQTEDVVETVADIEEGMNRIKGIVSDLRAFAYPDQSHLRDKFNLQAAIESAIRFTAHELDGIQIEIEIDESIQIQGSRSHITQVLVNLILNALNAVKSESSGRTPMIRISCATKGAKSVLSVWDNGTGIPGEVLPRVVEPFFTTADVGQGMGLGLSICDTIINNHGGTLDLKSEEGQWTEVSFDLPLVGTEIFA